MWKKGWNRRLSLIHILPKYANGKEITYTVTEEAVEGYETSVDGFNITNTYTTETTEVKGSKTWNDADNQDGKRPESITVRLLADVYKRQIMYSAVWWSALVYPCLLCFAHWTIRRIMFRRRRNVKSPNFSDRPSSHPYEKVIFTPDTMSGSILSC